MSDPSSAPPPQPTAPPEPEAPNPARHEHLLELEAGGKGWKRRRTVDYLKISPAGMELHHGGMLREPGAGSRRRVQYSISPAVKTRRRKRSP